MYRLVSIVHHSPEEERVTKVTNRHYNEPPSGLRITSREDFLNEFSTTHFDYFDTKQVTLSRIEDEALRNELIQRHHYHPKGYMGLMLFATARGDGIALGVHYEPCDARRVIIADMLMMSAIGPVWHRESHSTSIEGVLAGADEVYKKMREQHSVPTYMHVPIYFAFGCEHKFRSYGDVEAREKGWPFTHGRCLSHSVCEKCGALNIIDSSD